MTAVGGVLDASVLMAIILEEVSSEEADVWLPGACVSAVNVSAVVAKLADRNYAAEIIADGLARFNLDVRSFDGVQAERAGLLRRDTRSLGLSFGDRACLALAAELGRSAVTADRAWARLDIGIPIELIR